MKKTYKTILILVNLIIILITSLINSNYIITNILDYTKLFFNKLFPANILFLTLSSLLIEYSLVELIIKYFNFNIGGIYVFILSLISGFPSGSIYSKELLEKDIISINDANKIIKYTHFPNPLFVLASITSLINSSTAFKILLSIILSNFIIFLFNRTNNINITYHENNNSFSNILSKCIYKSFKSIILIYGVSLFFFIISLLITKYISLNTINYVFISGIFDLCKGVFTTSLLNDINLRSYFILFFISFGSISIHMQNKAILDDSKISYKNFLLGRIIGTILSFIIFFIIKKDLF